MKKPLFAIFISLALLSCSKTADPSYAEYWKAWGDQQLDNWVQSTDSFQIDAEGYCLNNKSVESLQTSWKDLANRWASMNGFPYHAINDLNLSFELYAWPDKRGMTAARLGNRITQGEVSLDQLNTATAAEKGLVALEWLVFEPSLTDQQRCNALPVIASHYQTMVAKIADYHLSAPLVVDEWAYESDSLEGRSIALNLLFQQIAQVSNRLRTSIDADGQLIPILSEGWLANSSRDIYASSLSSINQHMDALLQRAPLTINSYGLLDAQRSVLADLRLDMDTGVYRWKDLQQAIIDAEALVEGPVAQDLNVLIGFNNYDGD